MATGWEGCLSLMARAMPANACRFQRAAPSRPIMSDAMADFPFRIVGFDLDGTLLDTHEDLGAAVNHALALVERPPVPVSEIEQLIGGGAKKMLERALMLTGGIDEVQFPSLYQALLGFYEANIAVHTRLYPGGEAMLDGLAQRGVRLAVVTNKFESFATKVLTELGLLSRFTAVIGGDTLGPGRAKPSRDPIDAMVARLGGGRAAFVGDTTYDIRAARAAGVPSVAVSFGFNDLPPGELGADAVIDTFAELIPVLERLC
jgi:phosphoglycolate phosphatase